MKKYSKLLLVLIALVCMCAFAACGGTEASSDEATAEAPELTNEIAQADWDSYRQFIDLDTGITMAYVEMGVEDGEPLVLIHGMTDNSRSWSLIAPYLAEAGYHIYMVDLRGHGESDKPAGGLYTFDDYAEDIANFMDLKGIEKANIVGHSLGSMIAQTFEFLYPEKCDHVVWESTSREDSNMMNAMGATYYYEYALSLGEDGHPDDEFMEAWYSNNNPVDEEFLGYEMEESQALTGATWECIAGGFCFGGIENYYSLMDDSIPTLVLWGSGDGFFNQDCQDALKEAVPFVQYQVYDQIGHNIQWEIPEKMATDLIAFFNDEELEPYTYDIAAE